MNSQINDLLTIRLRQAANGGEKNQAGISSNKLL